MEIHWSTEQCPACGEGVQIRSIVNPASGRISQLTDRNYRITISTETTMPYAVDGLIRSLPPAVKPDLVTEPDWVVWWAGWGYEATSHGENRHTLWVAWGVPISQGSLAKMHKWFADSLKPSYGRLSLGANAPRSPLCRWDNRGINGIK